jgi:DNA-binding XRE family transcriptional regulator
MRPPRGNAERNAGHPVATIPGHSTQEGLGHGDSAIMAPAELRKLREAAGWTQARLATLCEVSWRTLVRWEQMRKVPIHSVAADYIKRRLEEAAREK